MLANLKKLLELVSASCFGPQVQKKVFIENTVPLIISLKSLLEQKRSPVLRDLMAYLQVRQEPNVDLMCVWLSITFVGGVKRCDGTMLCCSHQVTMQDYRNEVKEFFSGDEQLAAEVEFALKTAEKEREMEEQMENCSLSGDPKTPTSQVRTHHRSSNSDTAYLSV